MLHCDTGCSACDLPRNEVAWFTGTDAGWLGVDVCPHPIAEADNVVLSYGWPAIADDDHALLISGIAFSPMMLDSLVIRHRSGMNGPQRLRVRFGANENMASEEFADVPVSGTFDSTVLTGLGPVTAQNGMVYGFFSLVLQPYLGQGGPWELDDLRLVGTPFATTEVPDLSLPANAARLPKFDLLGRPVIERPGLRFYVDRSKHVVLR